MSAPSIKLMVTDLDGTLVGSGHEFSLFSEFSKRLNAYRERYGTVWTVCTGRSMRSFQSVLAPMRTMGIEPDYVIVHHAYIYCLKGRRYWPHFFWNSVIRFQVWSSSLHLQGALKEWLGLVRGMTEGVTVIYHRRNRLCLRFRHEEDAEAAAQLLRRKASMFKHLRVFQFMQEVDVRAVPFTKGMAVQELAQRIRVRHSEVLAMGNGHNDISMLDGSAAAYTGCPGNAETDVMETVHKNSGHVAVERGLEGVIAIMDAYLEDRVHSKLPEWWVPNSQVTNPSTAGRRMNHHAHHHRPHSPRIALHLGLLALYTVLVVFASFRLLPFSGLIMKPFVWVARLVEVLFGM